MSLEAMIEMGQILNEVSLVKQYRHWLEVGKDSFHKTLWNGEYYNCFEGCEDVMADQLCGQCYADLLDLPPIDVGRARPHSSSKVARRQMTFALWLQRGRRLAPADVLNLGAPRRERAAHERLGGRRKLTAQSDALTTRPVVGAGHC